MSTGSGMAGVSPRDAGPITELLDAIGRGDSLAHEQLWALVYQELRRVAHNQLAGERPDLGQQTTILVHEAYLRLVGDGQADVRWENRRHFFAAAANAMRRIRVDDARKRKRLKRGGPGIAGEGGHLARQPSPERARPVRPVEDLGVFDGDPAEVLAVDEALEKLQQHDPRKAEIVMLRYFAGLSIEETAAALGLSPRTVDKDWRFARVWLHRELR